MALIKRNIKILEEEFIAMQSTDEILGLTVNTCKTKYMKLLKADKPQREQCETGRDGFPERDQIQILWFSLDKN